MDEMKVWRVMVRIGDAITNCDMVYIDGIPHLVWEWAADAANEYPSVTIPLDSNHLQFSPGGEGYEFVYGPGVEEPGSAS